MRYTWSGEGHDTAGKDWTFDLYLDISDGGDCEGRFDWYIDGDLRGQEYVTGAVNRACFYTLQGKQKTSNRIVLVSYKGKLSSNYNYIEGNWVGNAYPGKFWSV